MCPPRRVKTHVRTMFSLPSAGLLSDDHVVIDIDYNPFPALMPTLKLNKGTTWTDKVDRLAACNCCTRHQNNKPKEIHVYQDIETGLHRGLQERLSLLDSCPCDCRHMARWICRLAKEREDGYIVMPRCHYTVSPRSSPTLDEEAM